jgi:hypothetical protein
MTSKDSLDFLSVIPLLFAVVPSMSKGATNMILAQEDIEKSHRIVQYTYNSLKGVRRSATYRQNDTKSAEQAANLTSR